MSSGTANGTAKRTWVIIPCSGQKASVTCPARELYTGTMFRHTLAAAESDAFDGAAVLVLSALHGLVPVDAPVAPYEQRIDRPGRVSAAVIARQAEDLGIGWSDDVFSLLPGKYFSLLREALDPLCMAQDVYEAAPGVGYQRGVNRCCRAA